MTHPSLTSNELHLLRALSTGDSNKSIALATGKAEQTVRNQLSRLYRKLNTTNRTQAVCWYREHFPLLPINASQPQATGQPARLRRAGDVANPAGLTKMTK